MTAAHRQCYYDPQKNEHQFSRRHLAAAALRQSPTAAPNYGNTGALWDTNSRTPSTTKAASSTKRHLRKLVDRGRRKAFESGPMRRRTQYSGIHHSWTDIKINGNTHQRREDLARPGGTLLAYLAWKEGTKNQKLDQSTT